MANKEFVPNNNPGEMQRMLDIVIRELVYREDKVLTWTELQKEMKAIIRKHRASTKVSDSGTGREVDGHEGTGDK